MTGTSSADGHDQAQSSRPASKVPDAGIANSMTGGSVFGPMIQVGHHSGPLVLPPQSSRVIPAPHAWPLAADWQPGLAGVRRSRPLGNDGIPPYIGRDIDVELRRRLLVCKEDGGFVLIVGNSAAGKTRTAFEAIRATMPDFRIASPETGDEIGLYLAALARQPVRCVLWLDDLDTFLGPNALNQDALSICLSAKVPVIATMRSRRFFAFQNPPLDQVVGLDPATAQITRSGARVLDQAEPMELLRRWTETELERAQQSTDERISDAVAHHGPHGVAEYLVAGPMIWSEWRQSMDVDGHPRGGALVAAAVDLARAGLSGPYAEDLLVSLHEKYLEAHGGVLLRPEPLAEALDWATRPRFGASSPLLPAGNGHWKAFDYLVDETERLPNTPTIPDATWQCAAEEGTDDDLMEIAIRAAETATSFTLDLAESIWRPMIDGTSAAENTLAAYNLGVMCSENGRPDEAPQLFLQAADGGSALAAYNLGVHADLADNDAEAVRWYKIAADRGHAVASFNLGLRLEREGQPGEAEVWYRRGAKLGDFKSATNLGNILADAGRSSEAHSLYLAAARAGDYQAAYNIGRFHHLAENIDQAEIWYRRAVEGGVPEAALNLGAIYSDRGDQKAAEALYMQAAERGLPQAMSNLGVLAALSEDLETARHWFGRAVEAGNTDAIHGLSRTLYKAGHVDEAIELLKSAAAEDDLTAIAIVGAHFLENENLEEAIPYLKRAAERGHVDSAFNLGALSANDGDRVQAKRWYRQAVEAGDASAAARLARLEFEDGRVATAAWWSRRSRSMATAEAS